MFAIVHILTQTIILTVCYTYLSCVEKNPKKP